MIAGVCLGVLAVGQRAVQASASAPDQSQGDVRKLTLSIVQAPGGPQRFYEGIGFRLTGEYEEGEAIMRLDFARDGNG